ncbi:hypothetical protein M513_09870, partial [Trichuris suis]
MEGLGIENWLQRPRNVHITPFPDSGLKKKLWPGTYKKAMTEYVLGSVTIDGKSSKPKDAGILEAA